MSVSVLAEQSGIDRATLRALEAGAGNLASLCAVAKVLAHALSPLPSALANKRRWLRIGSRSLAQASRLSRPTVQGIERTGSGRVASYTAMCAALEEPALLRGIEATWWTPPELIKAIMTGVGVDVFDLDPASPDLPTVPCNTHYTEKDGGLWLPWRGNIYVNPPYDDVPRWLAKANDEFETGRAKLVVCLVPYRPETNAWKVLVRSDAAIFVLEDRLRFGGRSYVSPSVSAVVVWGGSHDALAGLGATLPRHHRVVRTQTENWDGDRPALIPN